MNLVFQDSGGSGIRPVEGLGSGRFLCFPGLIKNLGSDPGNTRDQAGGKYRSNPDVSFDNFIILFQGRLSDPRSAEAGEYGRRARTCTWTSAKVG